MCLLKCCHECFPCKLLLLTFFILSKLTVANSSCFKQECKQMQVMLNLDVSNFDNSDYLELRGDPITNLIEETECLIFEHKKWHI